MLHCVEGVGVCLVLDVGEALVQPGTLALAAKLNLFDLSKCGENLLRNNSYTSLSNFRDVDVREFIIAAPADDPCSRSSSAAQCGSLST